jgi:hypothetical protein
MSINMSVFMRKASRPTCNDHEFPPPPYFGSQMDIVTERSKDKSEGPTHTCVRSASSRAVRARASSVNASIIFFTTSSKNTLARF